VSSSSLSTKIKTNLTESVSVCEAVSHCVRYNNETITVKGQYFSNRHGRWFFDKLCSGIAGTPQFAVADWTRSQTASPLESIVVARDGSGRPAILSGIVTADITVECIDQPQIERMLEDESEPGLIQDGRVASAIFYVLRITDSKPIKEGNERESKGSKKTQTQQPREKKPRDRKP
jgi:hypothetical protein